MGKVILGKGFFSGKGFLAGAALALLVLLASLVLAPSAWAAGATITVGANGDHSSLQQAVDAAQDGDTIKLLEDVNETAAIDGKALAIDFDGHTLSARGLTDSMLKLTGGANVTLKNGTLRDFPEWGVYCTASTLSIQNCTFDNTLPISTTRAALLATGSSTVSIAHSEFTNQCYCIDSTDSTVDISDTDFHDNASEGFDGLL